MDLDKLDSFESVFRSAVKTAFTYDKISLKKILFIDDEPKKKAGELLGRVKKFLKVADDRDEIEWKVICGKEIDGVKNLLQKCEEESPDLIITYRHLTQSDKNLRHSLGVYVDMITQTVPIPVLLLPYFSEKDGYKSMENTNSVTVVADHITGDNRLLNYGLYFTEPKGNLHITHIEDSYEYERYMESISKIKEIPTGTAKEKILHQLLKEPKEYIESASKEIKKQGLDLVVHPVVQLGHLVADYKKHITNHQVDLLIMNTKTDDHLAMKGMAYSLAVELIEIPLLLL